MNRREWRDITGFIMAAIPGTKDEYAFVLSDECTHTAHMLRLHLPFTRGRIQGVYFLVRGSAVIYVGSTGNLHLRVQQHRANGKNFDTILFLVVIDPKDLIPIEREWTARLLPSEQSASELRKAVNFDRNRLEKFRRWEKTQHPIRQARIREFRDKSTGSVSEKP